MASPESDPSLAQLRCFIAVVDAGSLAEAGRQLGMSAASVSKALARLEQSSGVKLLHRSTHAVSLTDDGEHLIESARDVVRAGRIFSGIAAARTQNDAPGWVRITAPVALMRVVLAPLLAEFSRVSPTVRLDVRASNELIDLAKGAVDLAIRSGPLERIPGHSQITWFKFPWVVCASPGYLDGRDAPTRPGDLTTHRLIGFRNQRTGQVRPWSFRPPGNTGDVVGEGLEEHRLEDGVNVVLKEHEPSRRGRDEIPAEQAVVRRDEEGRVRDRDHQQDGWKQRCCA